MQMLSLGCLFILLIGQNSLGVEGKEAGCKESQSCTCANGIMDCRGQSLTHFPNTVKISDDIKAIYLDMNKITSLSQIPKEPTLQTLSLTNNQIKTMRYDAFDNLDNLKILKLSNNSIRVISNDIFQWNPLKLEVLYLDSNKLEFIQHFLFYGLEELTDLYLQKNEIIYVHPNAFLQLKNLRNLRLDGNKLHTFTHKWIDKLQPNAFNTLRLDNNPWSCDCAMNHSLHWLQKAKSKWFHDLVKSNPLVCVTPKSANGQSFKELNKDETMRQCDMPRITGISKPSTPKYYQTILLRCVVKPDTYPVPIVSWTAPNHDVYRLNTAINYDGIEVHADGSLLIQNLSTINNGLYSCNATNSEGHFTAITAIKLIGEIPTPKPDTHITAKPSEVTVANQTPERDATAVAHKKCPDPCQCISRHIDCSGDGSDGSRHPMTSVPDDIPEDAVTINLAENELTSIGEQTFATFHHLEELRLDDNLITDIDHNAFRHLKILTSLTLRHNKMKDLPKKLFDNMPKLIVLVLDKNELTVLAKKQFDVTPVEVKRARKGNDKEVAGLGSLQWLYVRHNFIETIDADTFDNMPQIKFIHLESNRLLRLPPAESFPPAQLTQLTKILVDDNNFQCDCKMEGNRIKIREGRLAKPDLFGDGIKCSSPVALYNERLDEISRQLTCNAVAGSNEDLQNRPMPVTRHPEEFGSCWYLLYGGIAVIAVLILTLVFLILWRTRGSFHVNSSKPSTEGFSPLI